MKIEVTEEYILGALILEAQKRFPEYCITLRWYGPEGATVIISKDHPSRARYEEGDSLAAALQRLLTHAN